MLFASSAAAVPLELSYGGRLTDAIGRPVIGPVDLRFSFFGLPSGGAPLGGVVVEKDATPLANGMFQVALSLEDDDLSVVFPSADAAVYIEVKDLTNGKTYPRQRFSVVPFATKVPVDGTTLTFDATTGRLKLNGGNVTQGFYLKAGPNGTIGWGPGGTGNGDMEAATYDNSGSTANGVVDEAEDAQRLGGELPAYYAAATHHHNAAYSAINHNHDAAYSAIGHNHNSAYAALVHNHDAAYSAIGHTHAGVYSPVGHNHDASYAALVHNHDASYAALAHGHSSLNASSGGPTNVLASDATGNLTMTGSILDTPASVAIGDNNNVGGQMVTTTGVVALRPTSLSSDSIVANVHGGIVQGGVGGNVATLVVNRSDGSTPTYAIASFSDGPTERMRVTLEGKVGIGTANPGAKLDVVGPVRITNGAGGSVQLQTDGTAASVALTLPSSAGADGQMLRTNGAGALTWAAATPAGAVISFAGSTAPSGWLLCDGAAVSRTTYADLFAVIGTTYGAGNGSTTFNLPDLRGRAVIAKDDMGGTSANRVTGAWADTLGGTAGAETHTLTTAEMPSHSHGITDPGHQHALMWGNGSSFSADRIPWNSGSSNLAVGGDPDPISASATGITINNAGSGTAHNNMQPSMAMNSIIKY